VHTSASAGEGVDFRFGVTPKPAAGEGKVFVMDAAGHVSAHDALDVSRVIWKSKGVANEDEDVTLTGGLTVAGGVVAAVSGNGLVVALESATGRELWRQDIKIPVRSAPVIEGARVFVVTIDSQVFALDVGNGSVAWNARGINEGSSYLALASPVAAAGMVVAPFSSGELKVLQAENGAEIWSDMVSAGRRMLASSNFGGFGGDPVVVGNALYVASASGMVVAYRLDNGMRVWEQPVASTQTPLVAGNAVFLVSADALLGAFNRFDGRVFWTTKLPRFEDEKHHKDPYPWSGAVLAGGMLYVTGAHGEMKTFNPANGNEMASIEIPNGVFSPPFLSIEKLPFL
jgi:outer membrane protein assembly factor BamB